MTIKSIAIEDVRVLLPGIPAQTTRGFLGYCTISLLPWEKGWLLFDTGHYADRHLLLEALGNLKITPQAITCVVLSHLHYDHCLNLTLFPEATLVVASKELQYARQVIANQRVDYSIPDILDSLLQKREVRVFSSELELSPGIKVFETPGHTPGSIALQIKRSKDIVLCGDAIKNAWEFVLGRPDMVYHSLSLAQQSIQRIRKMGEIIIPGHDRPFHQKGEEIEFIGRTSWSILAELYPGEKGCEIFRLRENLRI
jgi:glyoxylase-like metal-dependent hydrolase (beta-lactamase superfamily II)